MSSKMIKNRAGTGFEAEQKSGKFALYQGRAGFTELYTGKLLSSLINFILFWFYPGKL
jgi:hypothetical protein